MNKKIPFILLAFGISFIFIGLLLFVQTFSLNYIPSDFRYYLAIVLDPFSFLITVSTPIHRLSYYLIPCLSLIYGVMFFVRKSLIRQLLIGISVINLIFSITGYSWDMIALKIIIFGFLTLQLVNNRKYYDK